MKSYIKFTNSNIGRTLFNRLSHFTNVESITFDIYDREVLIEFNSEEWGENDNRAKWNELREDMIYLCSKDLDSSVGSADAYGTQWFGVGDYAVFFMGTQKDGE